MTYSPKEVVAEPIITSGITKDPAHPCLRGFAELGFGALFGTIAGGTPFLIGVFKDPYHLTVPFTLAGLLYPAGVASGMIMGGYLTDSYSNYWAPFVGAYAGALVADVTAYFLADEYPVLSAMLVLLLPIATSMVATEISHTHHKHDEYYPLMITFPF